MNSSRFLSYYVREDGKTLLDAIWKNEKEVKSHCELLNECEKLDRVKGIWKYKELISYE